MTLVVLLLTLLLSSGCASLGFGADRASEASEARDYVYEDADDWIALAPATGLRETNQHPVEFQSSELVTLLGGIEAELSASRGRGVFSDRGGKKIPLFTQATLEEIAEPLAAAFARANPRQDVLLQVRQARPQQLVKWLNENRVTAVRLFHRDGQLHVIAGAVDVLVSDGVSASAGSTAKSGDYRGPAARITEAIPVGSRGTPVEATTALRSDFGVDAAPAGRDDWLVLDARAARKAIAGEEQPGQRERDSGDRPVTPQGTDGAETESAGSAADLVPESAPASLDDAARKRLRELRELRRRDLISESVYESLVRDVLGMEEGSSD